MCVFPFSFSLDWRCRICDSLTSDTALWECNRLKVWVPLDCLHWSLWVLRREIVVINILKGNSMKTSEEINSLLIKTWRAWLSGGPLSKWYGMTVVKYFGSKPEISKIHRWKFHSLSHSLPLSKPRIFSSTHRLSVVFLAFYRVSSQHETGDVYFARPTTKKWTYF